MPKTAGKAEVESEPGKADGLRGGVKGSDYDKMGVST